MNTLGCIYCGKYGPYTDEHVFPAGLGGDDRRFLLKKMVCVDCNTNVFSKLEAKFMRESPIALARVFLQEHGRGKGKKAEPPKFDPEKNTIIDPETGRRLEAELQAGGVPVLLPQIVMASGQLGCTGSDAPSIRKFLDQLTGLLSDEVKIVEKLKQEGSAGYMVTTLNWIDGAYVPSNSMCFPKPPIVCIWIESLSRSVNFDAEARLFLRSAGQVVLRVDEIKRAFEWLTFGRKSLSALIEKDLPASKTVEQPSMHLGMNVDLDAYSRVLAKIGMNFAIHAYGENYCRHSAFDDIKRQIVAGVKSIPMGLPGQECVGFEEVFSIIGSDCHVLMLTAWDHGNGKYSVLMVARLFNGAIHVIRLAHENASAPPIDNPIFMVVDYSKHEIVMCDLLQLVQKIVREKADGT